MSTDYTMVHHLQVSRSSLGMDQDKVKARSLDTTDMAEQVLSIEAQNAK
jgi:hypothetical protein